MHKRIHPFLTHPPTPIPLYTQSPHLPSPFYKYAKTAKRAYPYNPEKQKTVFRLLSAHHQSTQLQDVRLDFHAVLQSGDALQLIIKLKQQAITA
jgi:hypothetical protein